MNDNRQLPVTGKNIFPVLRLLPVFRMMAERLIVLLLTLKVIQATEFFMFIDMIYNPPDRQAI